MHCDWTREREKNIQYLYDFSGPRERLESNIVCSSALLLGNIETQRYFPPIIDKSGSPVKSPLRVLCSDPHWLLTRIFPLKIRSGSQDREDCTHDPSSNIRTSKQAAVECLHRGASWREFRLHCIVFFLTDWTVISRAGSESVESPHVRLAGPGGGQLIC